MLWPVSWTRAVPLWGASNQDDDFNGFTDLIAFNKYFGWYGDNMDDMGRWIDREHAAHPERKMGISEYGAGACVFQQEDSLRHPEPWGAMASRKLADLLSCGELETASGTRILVVQLHLVHVRLFGGRP